MGSHRWDPDIIMVAQSMPDGFADVLREMRASRDRRLDGVLRMAVEEGWTLTVLGQALGITRERVRQRAAKRAAPVWGVDIPPPPRRVRPAKLVRPELPADVIERLRLMQAVASRVNGGMAVDDRRRLVSVEFTAELARLVGEGWSVCYLARVVGVTYGAVRFRLARHGYAEPCPSMAHHRYLGRPKAFPPQSDCKYGHPLSGDNLYVWRGHRVCKACDRRRKRVAA